jgi:hypothetical protein
LNNISQELAVQKRAAIDQGEHILNQLQEINGSVEMICQEIGRQLQRQDEAERKAECGEGKLDTAAVKKA